MENTWVIIITYALVFLLGLVIGIYKKRQKFKQAVDAEKKLYRREVAAALRNNLRMLED